MNYARSERSRIPLAFILILLSIALAFPSVGADVPTRCARYARWLSERNLEARDAAVELEMPMSPRVMAMLTTETGRIDVLLGWWWPRYLKKKFPGRDLREVRWDELDYETQLETLRRAPNRRRKGFFQDRRIEGMKVRDTVRLTFRQPTEFLGRLHPAGTHEIDVRSVLTNGVEYRSPADMKTVSGVELKFRAGQERGETAPVMSAGMVSRDARTLLTGLGVPQLHQHVHIVGKLPIARLQANPKLEAALMGDFYRRANLIAEMLSIVHRGMISDRRKGSVRFFGQLTRNNLKGVTKYFLDLGYGEWPTLGDIFKMAWVGMRGSDKYDEFGLWGLEYRALSQRIPPKHAQATLDALQKAMISGDYGVTPERMSQWLDPKGRERYGNVMSKVASSWYQRSWWLMPFGTRRELAGTFLPKGFFPLRRLSKQQQELKMLLHDWSKDPLIFDQPELQKRIVAAQKRAIERIHSDMNPHQINGIMKDFLVESDLLRLYLSSIGVPMKVANE